MEVGMAAPRQPARKGKVGRNGANDLTDSENGSDTTADPPTTKRRGTTTAGNVTRMTVNVGAPTTAALQLVVEREGVTLTEAVRRLIAYGELIYRASKVDGKDVLIRDGEVTQLVLLA
jgi:hypothetical protein